MPQFIQRLKINRIHFLILTLLLIVISVSQFIIGRKSLNMGFFIDDWVFLSLYRSVVANPILDILNAWKNIGSHNFAHSYYIGILYSFFHLNYENYRYFNLGLKIFTAFSLYPLILMLFRRRLIAFLATLIYSIHFSTFGMLDGPSRGEDFIAIASMNLFLLVYIFFIKKGVLSLKTLIGLTILFTITVFFDPTRMFPLIIIVFLIEIYNLLNNKSSIAYKNMIIHLLVLYSPFILVFILAPHTIIPELSYFGSSFGIFGKLIQGNFQLLLVPFASLGSIFITRDLWPYLGQPIYQNFGSYLLYLLKPLLMFEIINIILAFFISKNPLRFFWRISVYNLIYSLIVFFFVNHWLNLPKELAAPVDPGLYLTPSLIGLFFISIGISLLREGRIFLKTKQISPGLFYSLFFSLIFIFLTWMFADYNSIFMGVHPYLGIPAIGVSIFMTLILVLIYDKLNSSRVCLIRKLIAPLFIVTFLVTLFRLSINSVDEVFYNWTDTGLRISDQERIRNQFWEYVNFNGYSKTNIPLIYFDTSEDYSNGGFYAEAIIWRVASWFDLKFKQPKESRYDRCDFLILDKSDLEGSVSIIAGKKTFVRNNCGRTLVYKTENFYAFKLKDRNLYPIRTEILQRLGMQ